MPAIQDTTKYYMFFLFLITLSKQLFHERIYYILYIYCHLILVINHSSNIHDLEHKKNICDIAVSAG